jgi:hypothetical protein
MYCQKYHLRSTTENPYLYDEERPFFVTKKILQQETCLVFVKQEVKQERQK